MDQCGFQEEHYAVLEGEEANFVAIIWDCPFSVWKPNHATLRRLYHHYHPQYLPPKSLYHRVIFLKSLNTQHGSFGNLSFLRRMSHTRLNIQDPVEPDLLCQHIPSPTGVWFLWCVLSSVIPGSEPLAALGFPQRGHNPSPRPLIDVVLAGSWYQARSVSGLIACASLLMFIRCPVPRKLWTSHMIDYDLQLEPFSISERRREFRSRIQFILKTRDSQVKP